MRSKPRRVAVVTSPAQNSHSKARLPSLQPHQEPLALAAVRSSPAPSGPLASISRRTSSMKCALLAAELRQPAIGALAALRPAPCASGTADGGRAGSATPRAPNTRRRPLLRVIGGIVEKAAVVGAEPREQRHVVGPHQHVDRIDLEQLRPRQGAGHMSTRSARPGGFAEALGPPARCAGPGKGKVGCERAWIPEDIRATR